MTADELLSIGSFARLSGLTVHALRHYDAVGLLAPAHVDAATGYRRFRRDQLRIARLIADLRWLDLPIEQVRTILDDPDGAQAKEVLARHAGRLDRTRRHLDRQLDTLHRYRSEGVPMPSTVVGAVPVQMKIAVTDRSIARRFFNSAFGLEETVIRHTDENDFSGYQFGTYGQPDFFILVLMDREDFDRPGPSTFGLLVDDLDAVHARAQEAGATEAVPVHSPEGMPRCSAVRDPDGNWIWLYQG